jgi:hypothetical protein
MIRKGSYPRIISRSDLQYLYVPISVIFPVFDGKFSANVDINRSVHVIRFCVIGMCPRVKLNRDETISQENPIPAR